MRGVRLSCCGRAPPVPAHQGLREPPKERQHGDPAAATPSTLRENRWPTDPTLPPLSNYEPKCSLFSPGAPAPQSHVAHAAPPPNPVRSRKKRAQAPPPSHWNRRSDFGAGLSQSGLNSHQLPRRGPSEGLTFRKRHTVHRRTLHGQANGRCQGARWTGAKMSNMAEKGPEVSVAGQRGGCHFCSRRRTPGRQARAQRRSFRNGGDERGKAEDTAEVSGGERSDPERRHPAEEV